MSEKIKTENKIFYYAVVNTEDKFPIPYNSGIGASVPFTLTVWDCEFIANSLVENVFYKKTFYSVGKLDGIVYFTRFSNPKIVVKVETGYELGNNRASIDDDLSTLEIKFFSDESEDELAAPPRPSSFKEIAESNGKKLVGNFAIFADKELAEKYAEFVKLGLEKYDDEKD